MQKLQVAESCEGINDPDEVCNPLDYKIEIQATSGTLRLALRKEDTLLLDEIMQQNSPSSVLTVEGQLDVVNKLLAGAEFSPACDTVNPGAMTLLITATANGPMAKTETIATLLPEG